MSIEDSSRKIPKIGLLRRIWLSVKSVWDRGWFEPHASFLTLKSFWAPFVVIVVVFVAMWIKVIVDEQLELGLDASLYEMYEWFKVPLWWLALLIPVLGLLNANHKSEQTRAQMELTRSQNNFANYYKHVEEFSEYLDLSSFSGSVDIKKIDSRRLHRLIFPQASEGIYKVALPALIDLWDVVESFVETCISSLRDELEYQQIRSAAKSHRMFIKIILNQGNIFPASLNDNVTEGKKGEITTSKPSVSFCMSTVLNEIEFAHWLFSFDTSFDKELLWDSVHQLLDQIISNMAINEFDEVITHMSDKSASDTLDKLEISLFEIHKHSVWLESKLETLLT